MHIHTRNVNTAFVDIVRLFQTGEYSTSYWTYQPTITKTPSRQGNCLSLEEPITITYEKPTERVLLNPVRDANPYFHMYEALWMLAGRNDLAPLLFYNKKMADFSDDGQTLNGAYGYRWRGAKTTRIESVKLGQHSVASGPVSHNVDQLEIIVQHLKADPTSRRAVLTMWNVEDDLLKVDSSKDVCCNLDVMFRLRTVWEKDINLQGIGNKYRGAENRQVYFLDMTVTNRSNDAIWGLLGANYVHFSILQEYMAARLGVRVGKYHHISNNLHVYDWNFKPDLWLPMIGGDAYENTREWSAVPLVKHDPDGFLRAVGMFVAMYDGHSIPLMLDKQTGWRQLLLELANTTWCEPFLEHVAKPMCLAWHYHKIKEEAAVWHWIEKIKADDWRMACREWMYRRYMQPKDSDLKEKV